MIHFETTFCIKSCWFTVTSARNTSQLFCLESINQLSLLLESRKRRKTFYRTLPEDVTSQEEMNLDFILGEMLILFWLKKKRTKDSAQDSSHLFPWLLLVISIPRDTRIRLKSALLWGGQTKWTPFSISDIWIATLSSCHLTLFLSFPH